MKKTSGLTTALISLHVVKLICLIIVLILSFGSFFACGGNGSSGGDLRTRYTVTFRQEGLDDVVKRVYLGDDLTDIPTPVEIRTGYGARWTRTEFKNVQSDIIVTAEYYAKKYNVYFDIDSGVSLSSYTGLEYDEDKQMYYQIVTYDSGYNIVRAYEDDKNFICWMTESGMSVPPDGPSWCVPSDLTVTPVLEDRIAGTYSITFFYGENDSEQVTITLNEDERIDLDDETASYHDLIPEFPNEEGYEYSWVTLRGYNFDFNDINYDFSVRIKTTAKQYKIYYYPGTYGEGQTAYMNYKSKKYGIAKPVEEEGAEEFNKTLKGEYVVMTATYGANFSLIKVTGYGYDFKRWVVQGTGEPFTAGVWNRTEDIYLVAEWNENSDYTGYY